MSNFMCDKCKVTNCDSPKGYIAGCECHKPDVEGSYRCMVRVKESTGIVITTYNTFFFKDKNWVDLGKNETILRWDLKLNS